MLGFLGSAITAAGNLWNNSQQQQNLRDQMSNQWQMFNASNNFNRQEAIASRQWQEKMISQYRDYMSPKNQMRLFEEAGLNPALMYGNIQDMNVSSSGSPQASSSGSYSPVSLNTSDYSDLGMQVAQVDLLKSQAEKNRAEAGLTSSNQATVDSLREGLVTLQNVQVEFTEANRDWLKALKEPTVNSILKGIDNLNEQMKLIPSMIAQNWANANLSDSRAAGQDIENVYKSSYWEATINGIAASTDLSHFEVRRGAALLGLEMLHMNADTQRLLSEMRLNGALSDFNNELKLNAEYQRVELFPREKVSMILQNNTLHFQLGQAKKFDSTERIINMISQCTSAGGTLVGGFGLAKRSGMFSAPRNRIGF